MNAVLSLYRGVIRPGFGGAYLSEATRDQVVRDVAAKHGVHPVVILCESRTRLAVVPRQEVMWRLCQMGYSTLQVGRALQRDHSTVIHGRDRHAARMAAENAVGVRHPELAA